MIEHRLYEEMAFDRAIRRWTTDGLPAGTGLRFWNELTSSCFTPLSIDAQCLESFRADLARMSIGEIGVARIQTEGSTVRHTHQHVAAASAQAAFLLHFQTRGRSLNVQGDRSVELEVGDCTLVDSTRPYTLEFGADTGFIVCRLPAERLSSVLPHPEDLVAYRISGGSGATRALWRLVDTLWTEGADDPDNTWLEHADACILQMLATAARTIDAVAPLRGAGEPLYRRAVDFIRHNMTDPDMTVAGVADELCITPRYLQQLFAGHGGTPTSFIQKARVDYAARQLRQNGASITSIAMEAGFNDLTHFGRTFRRYQGCSPAKFRVMSENAI